MKASHARIDFAVFGCVFFFYSFFFFFGCCCQEKTFYFLHDFIGHVNNIHRHKEHGKSD